MKRLNQILVIMCLLISISSCKKDKDNQAITKETISAKWVVLGTNSTYQSFEFNASGNYIVVQNTTTKSTDSQKIIFGTYKIIDNLTIVLSDFGTLKNYSIANNNFSFTVILQNDPNNEIAINSTKAAKIANSTKTDLLSRTWKLLTINGIGVEGTENELTVLFSASGTYFVFIENPTDESGGGLAQWTWKDSNETKFCYSWEGNPTCDGENEVEITELNNSVLKILEVFDEDKSELYVFEPVNNNKSATLKINEIQTNISIKRGFLKK